MSVLAAFPGMLALGAAAMNVPNDEGVTGFQFVGSALSELFKPKSAGSRPTAPNRYGPQVGAAAMNVKSDIIGLNSSRSAIMTGETQSSNWSKSLL